MLHFFWSCIRRFYFNGRPWNLISYLLDCSSYLISLHSKVEKLQWESRNLEQHVFACFDLWMLEPFDAPTHLPSIHRCFTFFDPAYAGFISMAGLEIWFLTCWIAAATWFHCIARWKNCSGKAGTWNNMYIMFTLHDFEFKCVSVLYFCISYMLQNVGNWNSDQIFLNLQALQSMALDAAAALMLAQTRQAALYFRAPEALERLSIISWISCSFCHNSHTPGNCTAFLRCPNQHEDIWFCSVSMRPKH